MPDKRTPLHSAHKKLGARLIPFGGWEMPVEYAGIAKEHTAVRTAAGLFDVSHMGEFNVTGPESVRFLQHVTCNDISGLADGQAQYSALPYPEGTVVDDLLVYRRSPTDFMVVVNASNIDKDLEWMRSHNRFDAVIENVSERTALLALQGPRAIDILKPLSPEPIAGLGSYRFLTGTVLGHPALISRTGYTGEDGFELYLSPEHAEEIWNTLMESGQPYGLLPAGLGARNTLRLEARMMLYGNDIDQTTTLLEAGLGWIVKFDKGDFVGRSSLQKQRDEGVSRKLVGFAMTGREVARDHYPVLIDGVEVGHVTSGSPSITLKRNIGLGYVPAERATIGQQLQISVRGRPADATIVATPFYKRSKI